MTVVVTQNNITSDNANITALTASTVNSLKYPDAGPLSNRNKIINGDMRIDQRNGGASVTPTAWVYTVDRWQLEISQASKLTAQQNAGSVTPPAGFKNYLGVTVASAATVGSSDYFELNQAIEGFNTADLGYGAAGASTVTLSYWVRSSLTGTHSGSLMNSANNRSYPFTFSIGSANTWEYKTVTITGDTTGTWLTNNSAGIQVRFSLGGGSSFRGTAGAWTGTDCRAGATGGVNVVATLGATFYITGVQLEVGTVATPFEHRSFTEELALCERYCQGFPVGGRIAVGNWNGSTQAFCTTALRTTMRATPTLYSYTAGKVLVEAVGWYDATTVVLSESVNTHVTFYITGITNSGQSSNANATWGNGASAVIQAEF